MAKKGVLLVNLGTPDSPKNSDVRKYLREFLTDKRVIDIPWLPRQLLVKGIIAPFRAPSSAKSYKEIWDDERGSPLLYHSQDLHKKVEEKLGDGYQVELAMRYQSPSINDALERLRGNNVDDITVLPLFPHYASASGGSVIDKVMEITGSWLTVPNIRFISSFYDHPKFIDAFVEKGQMFNHADYDHVLFSYHGLPERHLRKSDTNNHCLQKENCCGSICDNNKMCYSAQCHDTTRLLAERLGISPENYTTCYQSRLGKDPWVQPYTIKVLEELAHAGKKNLLVFSPAFVADCLETIFEIAVEYQEDFEKWGGEHVQMVESLNDSDTWVDCVIDLVG